MPLPTNILDSRLRGNDRQSAYFVIPAKAGIHELLPLNSISQYPVDKTFTARPGATQLEYFFVNAVFLNSAFGMIAIHLRSGPGVKSIQGI